MDDLVKFVSARLDEKARADWHVYDCAGMDLGEGCGCGVPERVSREVEAGRKILAMWSDPDVARNPAAHGYVSGVDDEEVGRAMAIDEVVRILATVDSDHPDYDPEWNPDF